MDPATKDYLNQMQRMLEDDMRAISDDIRKTNAFLLKMIEKYDRKLDQHDARITKLESK